MLKSDNLLQIPYVSHGFFGREGGVSEGIYGSLNVGFGSGDDPKLVAENRRRVSQKLGTDVPPVTAFQIHSAKVVHVTEPWAHDKSPEADALITTTPGLPIGVLTADCLPVLMAARNTPIIAAVHSGWKGAFGGILEAATNEMRKLGAEDIVAAIGPAIAQVSYEVGPEFYERINEPEYFSPSYRKGYWRFNLKAYAADRLEAAGIEDINILAEDTYLQEDAFFSYRRATKLGEQNYGRQISVIMIED